jgi:hypothetical protein
MNMNCDVLLEDMKPEPKRRGRKPKINIPPQNINITHLSSSKLKETTVLWLPILLTDEQRARISVTKSPKCM